jgi:hypothetical protein
MARSIDCDGGLSESWVMVPNAALVSPSCSSQVPFSVQGREAWSIWLVPFREGLRPRFLPHARMGQLRGHVLLLSEILLLQDEHMK